MPSRRLIAHLAAALVATSSNAWTARAASSPPVPLSTHAVQLAPQIVTAARTPQPPEHTASTVRSLDWETLRALPAATLDGQLRTLPSFTLFRRSDSLTANPTAQGVSLRGLGPSGASRSLVLFDGVPLNDPFGGWVAWTKVPRENLLAIEVVPGGGATAWGNAALGGVVQVLGMNTRPRRTQASAILGDYGTRSFEFAHTQPGDFGRLDLGGRAFATDGFVLVAPERRGPIDIAAWSRHRWLNLRWRQSLGEKLDGSVAFRNYEEKRGNGTPYQRNATREKFLSFTLAGAPGDNFGWDAVVYGQDQSFASTFSGVNATRTAETPASDQFAVPATALGAAWTGTWRSGPTTRTAAGADLRFVRGETREHFIFVAGNFTRLRVAGGRQAIAGLFALHERPLAPAWRATVGARLDAWRDTDGHRRESDRTTGVVSRDDHYVGRDGVEFSPSAGLVWTPSSAWRLRANAQQAFRRPTLNELYRPFRQGANVTEANAGLGTERVTSAELGAEWKFFARVPAAPAPVDGVIRLQTFPSPAPAALLTLGAVAFWNDLHDAVGNVTIARGPGTFPIVGTLAAGGIGRQRLNLDRTRTQGVEFTAAWRGSATLTVDAAAIFNDATVRRASAAPALVGKRVAQVPRRSASLGATWQAPGAFVVTPRVRLIGRQFEDDENQLTLGAVVVADLGISRRLSRALELFFTLENIGNVRIETGRSADGVVNIGTPRLLLGGLRGSW